MLRGYAIGAIIVILLATVLFMIKPPEVKVGGAAILSDISLSTQKVISLDFEAGTHQGTSLDANNFLVGTNARTWISDPIDTRPGTSQVAYNFWDKISVSQTGTDTYIRTRTSPNNLTWTSWSYPIILDNNAVVQAPQDRYLQVMINFAGSNTISNLNVYYTPAFEFNMNPLDNTNTVFSNDKTPANRRIIASGNEFVYEDNGAPAKFYGVQLFTLTNLVDQSTADEMCTYLSSRGYNLIKTHIISNTANSNIQDYTIVQMFQDGTTVNSGSALNFNSAQLDKLDYLIYRCKQEGIYVYLRLMAPRPHLDDVFEDKNIRPYSQYSEYFMPDQSQFHKEFYTRLLNHENPYTGFAYKDDPAIAFYELTNENHVFHAYKIPAGEGDTVLHAGGFTNLDWHEYAPSHPITPNQNTSLNLLWNEWLRNKYSDRNALVSVWGDDVVNTFDFEGTPIPEYGLRADEDPWSDTVIRQDWKYLSNGGGRRQYKGLNYKRYEDLALFYQELEINFFSDHINEIKNVIGARGLITGTNLYRGSYNLESQMTADFIDNHAYWQAYVTQSDDVFSSMLLSLKDDENNIFSSLSKSNSNSMPLTVSEYNSFVMSMYDADLIPFVDAYSAFQGYDAMIQFHFADLDITNPNNRKMWQHSVVFDPVKAITVPISSKAYLEWISPSNTVINYYFSDSNEPFLDASGNFQSMGLRDSWLDETYLKNNYLFKHGYEVSSFDSASPPDYSQFQFLYGIVDNPETQIYSDTNELYVDTDNGIFYPLHSKYKGAAGLTGGSTHTLPGLEISISKSAFNSTTILLGSLDDQDLENSNKILVTAGVRAENYGTIWNVSHNNWIRGSTGLTRYYSTPVLATGIDATIKLNTNLPGLSVYKLTPNGQLGEQIPSSLTGGVLEFNIRNDDKTIWYLIKEGSISYLKWDLDKSGTVDLSDVTYVLNIYRTTSSDVGIFDPAADFNGDNKINIFDLTEIAIHYGDSI